MSSPLDSLPVVTAENSGRAAVTVTSLEYMDYHSGYFRIWSEDPAYTRRITEVGPDSSSLPHRLEAGASASWTIVKPPPSKGGSWPGIDWRKTTLGFQATLGNGKKVRSAPLDIPYAWRYPR